ncbi:Predicted amidohydrolase [Balnearium lithotrophicum]|uniref:Predicted amidohydrolase n=1 Tax=Balnearium lithotrophicum TaxID=223788 RepID=A0A521BHA5_9BACT|nr:nitrilase-related carbon-nitrogen hydrolase [Balnearium lithotrophicum]SMO46514.1 Predicted amidohydrolase [Balnearium lithotrophicum]
MRKTFKAYSIQFESFPCGFKKNYSKFLTLLNLCERDSLVVAPEVFPTGFCYKNIDEAVRFSEKVCNDLMGFSEGLNLTVVFSVFERINGKLFNSIKVLSNGRELLSRPKVKLFKPGGEGEYFTEGRLEDLKVAKTPFGVVAPVVCFELRFFEILKRLKELGGEVFTVSAQWGRARKFHWEILIRSRALELQRFFVGANGTGKEMGGSSAIVDPWGRVISEAGDSEGIISGSIDLKVINQVEKKLPLN